MKKVFRFKKGRGLSGGKSQAQVVGQRLNEMERERGELTPDRVVREAKKKSSPLHRYFTWDDGRAADLQRLAEARFLIRSIEVTVIVGPKKKEVITRAFANLRPQGARDTMPYLSSVRVLRDAELRERWVSLALGEAESWMARYQHLNELSSVFRAVERARERIASKRRKKKSG